MQAAFSKRGGRRDTIITRSRSRKKSKCTICSRIIRACEDTSNSGRTKLGTFKEVMQSSDCDVHPSIIRACLWQLENLSKRHDIDSISCPSSWNLVRFNMTSNGGFTKGTDVAICLLPAGNDQKIRRRGKTVDSQWIDQNMLRRWKWSCDSQQKNECQVALTHGRLKGKPPTWLVDTWLLCLVPGERKSAYVALSYMWGSKPFFRTSASNLAFLQTRHALKSQVLGIPQTISNAFSVTEILGERYLWVDSLCIVQDDKMMLQDEIDNMGFIFANASITIIARQGEDASYGLRGLRGLSQPRSTSQETFRVNQSTTILKCYGLNADDCTWAKRGWTYQENVFSRRTLSFHKDRVWWKCSCSSFAEDLEPRRGYTHHTAGLPLLPDSSIRNTITSEISDLQGFERLVTTYNTREFTYPEDAQAAFSGITTVLASSFPCGFIYGLPNLFIDIALCWQPLEAAVRRRPRCQRSSSLTSLPSWSWMGWKTNVRGLELNNFYLKPSYPRNSRQIVSSVKWHSRSPNSLQMCLIEGPQLLRDTISEAERIDGILPLGWQRYDYQAHHHHDETYKGHLPKYIFRHDSQPNTNFRHPLPACQDSKALFKASSDSLLCCRTQKVVLYLGRDRHIIEEEPWGFKYYRENYSLLDWDGKWAGFVQLTAAPESPSNVVQSLECSANPRFCDLVMISEGYAVEGSEQSGMDEWKLAERPKSPRGQKYEFYNVLMVEWEDGIAYRSGCGRVMKSAWEAQNAEWIDLTLG